MEYLELCELYEKLNSTAKRLEKTKYISELIKKTSKKELNIIMLLLQGRLFPLWEEKKIGAASRLVLKAINISTGIDTDKIEESWKEIGDLGLVAEQKIKDKSQETLFSADLSINKVYTNLIKLAELEGSGTVNHKVKLIAELLTSAKPIEAKYIIRTVLEDLRVGVGDSSIRDAVVWTYFSDELNISYDEEKNVIILPDNKREKYNKYIEKVQEAYNLTNDLGEVAALIKEKGLDGISNIKMAVGKPVKVMLYQKAKDIDDAFNTVGRPAALEFKYDGFRVQIHYKKDDSGHEKMNIFTRRLENVTERFPDILIALKGNINADSAILDAEAVGFDPKSNKYLPFQSISQRIKRKYSIIEISEKFPVEVNIFDVLYYNGKNTLNMPFHERRKIITSIIEPIERKIVTSRIMVTGKNEEAMKFYHEALDKGEEGVMIKNLEGIYKPGARVGYGVKLKPVMESLDLVIVQAEWGEGKRATWLTSFTLACKDENNNLIEIGKVSTGLKELEQEGTTFNQITELLKPLIKQEKGKIAILKPKVVIEVQYEEIQASPTYSSGFALRFPRFIRLRDMEKDVDDIDDLQRIKELYTKQRGRG
jgi:DNA ligase-1